MKWYFLSGGFWGGMGCCCGFFLSLSIISFIIFFFLNTVCEGSTMNLKCPTGKINIEYANYGRTDGNVCSKTTISTTNCKAEDSEKIVKSQCDGKTNCSIDASNSVFLLDPCLSVGKYLEVKFTCVQGYKSYTNRYVS